MWRERRCMRVRETLSVVLDGEASEADVLAAVKHVRRCVGCRDFVVGVVTTTRALRAARVIRPSSVGHRG